jgi:hypothetical protein|tara:strand:- start:169 stop:435 length:267 start_codon:yes stop_codon:yes gene_type:complete
VENTTSTKLVSELDSVQEVHDKILNLAGDLMNEGAEASLVCSTLIAVALRSYATFLTQEDLLSLLDLIVKDIDKVRPYDINLPSTELH